MFTQISPQQVRHSDGYTIQIGGRDSVQYKDKDSMAEVESDMLCDVIPLYCATLKVTQEKSEPKVVSQAEKDLIIRRIESGLKFMNIKYELIY